jgi:4-hydroxy-4-methyl-2-oxoglutarate aldolase
MNDNDSANILEALRQYPTATLCEAYSGKGALPHNIKPIRLGMKICGPALTVTAHPGDNLIVHKAIYEARPGDVLFVATASFLEAGFWGMIMTEAAIQRGITGLVTDGSVRDTDEISQAGFPIFSAGVCIKGTTKVSPGTFNQPIYFNAIKIDPGDFVVGDSDGVVVIAQKDIREVIEKAKQREMKEKKVISDLKQGKTTLEIYGFH